MDNRTSKILNCLSKRVHNLEKGDYNFSQSDIPDISGTWEITVDISRIEEDQLDSFLNIRQSDLNPDDFKKIQTSKYNFKDKIIIKQDNSNNSFITVLYKPSKLRDNFGISNGLFIKKKNNWNLLLTDFDDNGIFDLNYNSSNKMTGIYYESGYSSQNLNQKPTIGNLIFTKLNDSLDIEIINNPNNTSDNINSKISNDKTLDDELPAVLQDIINLSQSEDTVNNIYEYTLSSEIDNDNNDIQNINDTIHFRKYNKFAEVPFSYYINKPIGSNTKCHIAWGPLFKKSDNYYSSYNTVIGFNVKLIFTITLQNNESIQKRYSSLFFYENHELASEIGDENLKGYINKDNKVIDAYKINTPEYNSVNNKLVGKLICGIERITNNDNNNNSKLNNNSDNSSDSYIETDTDGTTRYKGNTTTATGFQTTASGSYSTALGFQTTASGDYSTALGRFSNASGNFSTAMGQTTAIGLWSTAMGQGTKAEGNYSTAMGNGTTASGSGSTAMGSNTTASADASTAMGQSTTASGTHSTAMGYLTTASGLRSTAMGTETEASGTNSVAMGTETEASGTDSAAMGFKTTATGDNSTAMGTETEASGDNSTAMGTETEASGTASTAMGLQTIASNEASTAMGLSTTASGNYSAAMGNNTEASGTSSTAMGFKTTASGTASTAMGAQTTASGDFSTAMGDNTEASGTSSTAMGYLTKAKGTYSTAMGDQTTASGLNSTAMGYLTVASGDYSTAMGYNTEASGTDSTAMGVETVASGVNSTAMGKNTTASGPFSTAIGGQTTASGTYSTAMGDNTEASGNFSVAMGSYNETRDALFVIGNGTGLDSRSDAFKVESSGNVTAAGSVTATSFEGDGSKLKGLPSLKDFEDLKKENKTLRNELNALKAHLRL